MSGFGTKADFLAARDAGADAYLTKPLCVNQLRMLLSLGRRLTWSKFEQATERAKEAAEAHPDADDPERPIRVLFVDNDALEMKSYVHSLRSNGFDVVFESTAAAALHVFHPGKFDVVVTDILMPAKPTIGNQAGFRTGLVLAQKIRERAPRIPIVALTSSDDAEVKDWFSQRRATFLSKRNITHRYLPRMLKRILGREPPQAFIVHGHDHETLDELKTYLAAVPIKVIVLSELPNAGQTVIEAIEQHGADIDLVFVLMTPDEDLADGCRARQNVIFEYGYFLGSIGRQTGRVILLYKRDVEMPSDLAGLTYIDITDGIAAAKEKIDDAISRFM